MDKMNRDLFMNALRKVNPELVSVVDFLKNQNADTDRVRTFEDCARVEQDIMSSKIEELERKLYKKRVAL